MMIKTIHSRTWIQPMLSAALAFSLALSPTSVWAASSSDDNNNAALTDDLYHSDIIDEGRTGSLYIHKYDISAAEAAGDYVQGKYRATGQEDSRVEAELADYAVQGVQFTYMKVGEIEQYSKSSPEEESEICVAYEIPEELRKILQLNVEDALDMSAEGVASPCTKTDVLHYTSTQISEALKNILDEDEIRAKNALEDYLYDYEKMNRDDDDHMREGAVNMHETDEYGTTYAYDLPLGLYLIVETKVPEQVTSSVDPWFVSIPFTNLAADGMSAEHNKDGVTDAADVEGTQAKAAGGEKWLYDVVCYPKNQSGNPTFDKSVRNAYTSRYWNKNQFIHLGDSYDGSEGSSSLIVRNESPAYGVKEKDTNHQAYVSNRGGYTMDGITSDKNNVGYSYDYQYRDTTTASEGDLLDYILVSRLPHITSKSTYLSTYMFVDQLSEGITYNSDVRIALYKNREDAQANNTAEAKEIWNLYSGGNGSGNAVVDFSTEEDEEGKTVQKMQVYLTDAGLRKINGGEDARDGYSDCYIVLYYTATVNSDATVILGDEGNPNDAALIWSRTNNSYYNSLQDRNYVYSYGIDLTKTFSDNRGVPDRVQFKLYNETDDYYVVARKENDGLYYVTGKTKFEDSATTFVPKAQDGKLYINGLEAYNYQLTEVSTDDGYTLLRDPVEIEIQSTDREVIAAVAGAVGLDEEAMENIVKNYDWSIQNEDGQLVTEAESEFEGDSPVAGPVVETPNGRTIGLTDMYVGEIHSASATVDKSSAKMETVEDTTSENAMVPLQIVNNRGFLLPQTGGSGLYLVTILGVLTAGAGFGLLSKKSRKKE